MVGARPQFIKASPVSEALRNCGISERMVHTGQHYDPEMSQVFFDELAMPSPAINLEVGSGSHGEQTAQMLIGLERDMRQQSPDLVLVYGDTNSTIAGALAAAKLNIPLAHVEAGLRSFNRQMPEEINRVVTDSLSDLLFSPTQAAVQNLQREGIPPDKIRLVGDVMFDAAIKYGADSGRAAALLDELSVQSGEFILATVHRASNTDGPHTLSMILDALANVSKRMPVIFPLHPRTRARLPNGWESDPSRLKIIPPRSYLEMLSLERNSALVVTDSGGVQKEAFFFKVPCVTLRGETEWVELVKLGWNRLCEPSSVESLTSCILGAIGSQGSPGNPFGDGRAASRIADSIVVSVPK